MFSSAEFLTAKQRTSFFSRLAAKRNLSAHSHVPVVSDEEEEEEDGEAVNIETAYGELRDHVMASVQPTNPICFQSYNLCHMMSNSKLSSFSITMLKDICEYFLIDAEDITTKRKGKHRIFRDLKTSWNSVLVSKDKLYTRIVNKHVAELS